MHTIKILNMNDPIISDGKCKYRYILEKAINTASGIATMPNFRFAMVRMVAAIKEANAWPEGNEKSYSFCTIIGKLVSCQQGLNLPTRGFRPRFPIKKPRKIPMIIIIP